MNIIILSFVTAFLITFAVIPSIIHVAKVKRLMDKPGERSSHSDSIPTLGGIGIFAGVIFSITFWTPFQVFSELQYILCAFIIIFLIGAKDDILPLTPAKKFIGELFATFILVFKADVQLNSLYGIFGITDLPEFVSIALSMFVIILIINAVNLIDGINGLSGTVGSIIAITFGIWFYQTNVIELAVIAFALTGALVAFLKYNYTPAKIFMGDTGALLIGLIISILSIKFIDLNKGLDHPWAVKSVPAVAVGVMIIPLFDTLRVFTIRILKGRSPFSPDRNHIHHLLLDMGCSHMQGTLILSLFNIGFIALVFSLQHIGNLNLLFIVLGIALLLTTILHLVVRKKRLA
ncbi:MAG: MraY family glycosyltransferase, partial [Bacteroidota bacterium]